MTDGKSPPDAAGGEALSAADKATVLGLRISKRALAWTIVGVVVAVAGVVAAFVLPGGGGQSVSGTGNQVNQNSGSQSATGACGQVGTGNSCVVQLQELAKESPTDEEFKAGVAKLGAAPPEEPGPWAFVVVDTGELGLFARSTNELQGSRVGLALNREMVWVDCMATSDFTPPDPTNDVGPVWLKVRWKNDQTSATHMYSDPDDPKRAWMYRGLTVPFGHNGDVPDC